ncbi:MAG TPA: hypothetical protein VGL94_05835 [Ktedonobacteraceae bacterium]|jgi:type I restriction-modification system DNA methylase subunit
MGEAVLRDYLDKVEQYYQKGIATEHSYRGTLQHLLEKLETGVFATNEPKRVRCGAPDYLVERNNFTIGYVEAKDLRETRGVYYTPEPVASYIVRSVDHLLHENFDCIDGLADTTTVPYNAVDETGKERVERTPRVVILDPATGTGTFLIQATQLIREIGLRTCYGVRTLKQVRRQETTLR